MWVVGMSGGVDSSVTALLMQRQGHDVRGVYMHNWESDDPGCRAAEDRRDAVTVCGKLGIPFQTMNFAQTYREQVFEEFLNDYAKGVTPNPDILCNREVKFKAFLNAALEMGAEGLATGHYARKARLGSSWALLRGRDPGKDQSYFLHAVTQAALAVSQFPVGELPKSDVRRLAEEAGLATARKKDSTGICFIGEQDFKTFLSRYLPAQAGAVETLDGHVIGQHGGALYYTVGQRAPLGGVKGFPSESWFVLAKDVARNVLVVGQGANHPALMANGLTTEAASWIAGEPPADTFDAEVQLRHLGTPEPARVRVTQDGTLDVRFADPVRAVAPGQAAVVYQGEVCLGGAPIAAAWPGA